jgi:hypothetical protein
MLAELLENGVRDLALFLILVRIAQEVFPDESTTAFLKLEMRVGVVGGGETAEVRRFGERDGVGFVGGHDEGMDVLAAASSRIFSE